MVKTFNTEAVEHLKILGVHACASPEEINLAYNQLTLLYENKKETTESINSILQQHFKKIQTSYDFVRKNYAKINQEFSHLEDFVAAARNNGLNLAFWVYDN
jgi:DnaJ-class molecular chaperone